MINFPVIPQEELEAHKLRWHAEVHPITYCSWCKQWEFIHRLGCRCGRWVGDGVEHAYVHNGQIIREGIDFSFLPEDGDQSHK